MPNRVRQFILACFLLASAAIAGGSMVGCSNDNARMDEDVFINQMGKEVRLKDFKGKVVFMNFVFTSCPHGGCNLLTLQFLRVQNYLKDRVGKDLFLLSVTVDPENDTREVLKEFASNYKVAHDGWYFLTSDKGAVERLMKKYNVLWKTDPDGSRHHKVVMALLDKEGRKVAVYDDLEHDTLKIVEDITKLLDPPSDSGKTPPPEESKK